MSASDCNDALKLVNKKITAPQPEASKQHPATLYKLASRVQPIIEMNQVNCLNGHYIQEHWNIKVTLLARE